MDTNVDVMKVTAVLTAILTAILGKDNEARKRTMQYQMRLNLDHEGDNYENQSGELEKDNRLDPPNWGQSCKSTGKWEHGYELNASNQYDFSKKTIMGRSRETHGSCRLPNQKTSKYPINACSLDI